jgi:predicted nucleic acid-binding protein
MTVVVDASVLVKVFVDEPGSDIARDVLERSEVAIAPAHVFGEVGEVLARRFGAGEVSRAQLDLVVAVLPGMIAVVSLEEILGLAIDIAVATKASVYDTLYVATAVRRNVPLVTADQRLVDRLGGTIWANLVRPLGQSGKTGEPAP